MGAPRGDVGGDLRWSSPSPDFIRAAAPSIRRFAMLFDTDNDPSTGGTFGLVRGVDKVVEVSLRGSGPFTPPDGAMTVSVLDVASGISTGLTAGAVDRLQRIIDHRRRRRHARVIRLRGFDQASRAPPAPRTVRSSGTDRHPGNRPRQRRGGRGVVRVRVGRGRPASARCKRIRREPCRPTTISRANWSPSVRRELLRRHLHWLYVNNNGNVTFDQPLTTFTRSSSRRPSGRSSPLLRRRGYRARETSSPTETVPWMGGRPSA